MINRGSLLWQYLSPQQRVLVGDGEFLVEDSARHPNQEPTDYSYLVFPYAKMFEGFLKTLFLDVGFIYERDYYSNHFRIGKVLSPNLVSRLGRRSVYGQIEQKYGKGLSARVWNTWREGRNLVFHYYPHNYRALKRDQALILIDEIVNTMNELVQIMHVKPNPKRKDICYIGQGDAGEE